MEMGIQIGIKIRMRIKKREGDEKANGNQISEKDPNGKTTMGIEWKRGKT